MKHSDDFYLNNKELGNLIDIFEYERENEIFISYIILPSAV